MVFQCWCHCFIVLLLVTSSIQAIPITSTSTSSKFDDTGINFHRLTQQVSNHLLFDHVDLLVYQLSQRIASSFRTSMSLKRRPFLDGNSNPTNRIMVQSIENHVDQDTIHIDMEVLLGQLQGAVGSFLEDKLPGIWNRQLAGLDRSMMQAKLEHHLLTHCPNQHSSCMREQSIAGGGTNDLLSQIVQIGDQTIQEALTLAWQSILQDDLPYLFNAAKSQVHGVLSLFDPPQRQDYQLQWDIDWHEMQTLFMQYWTTLASNLPCHPSDHSSKLQWIHYSKQP